VAKTTLKADVLAATTPVTPDAEQVTQRRDGDTLEAKSTSRRIKTVEDLLRHIEADMTRYEVAASEATKWECGDGSGGAVELHRVFVRLKPKAGPGVLECVEAMIAAAAKDLRRKSVPRPAKRNGLWQVVVVSDVHFGNYAYKGTTGGANYDLYIAEKIVRQVSGELLAVGDAMKPARRTIAFLGDILHYDNPRGQTTSGTQLERDGRLQKMLQIGWDTLLEVVERSAAPTDVLVVNGNHDETLSWAWQRVLMERFRNDGRVTVSDAHTGRQYATHGRNLLGFAHGHKAKRKLGQIMALEQPKHWSNAACREWHTGHYHSQAAEWQRPIETIDGVIVRTAPAICPPDDWHAENGFIGSRRAMETFLYRPEGGLVSMHVAGVD
jgi:metallophosphoesterase superfamily enzyme